MNRDKMRVAVVGAGVAGTVAAVRLWQRLGDNVAITVYERNEHAGGRIWNMEFADAQIEAGNALLHSSGKYTMELMKLTGSKQNVFEPSENKDTTWAFWTDRGFAIHTRASTSAMATSILAYVGLGSARKTMESATAIAAGWERIYKLLENERAFATPQELLKTLGLYEMTQVSIKEHLAKLKINERMTFHVVEPMIHARYNQGVEISAFAGLIGFAGTGLAGGHPFAVEGGNWTVFDKALTEIGADLRTNTPVTTIEKWDADKAGSNPVASAPTANGTDAGGGAGADAGGAGGAGADAGATETTDANGRPRFVVTSADGKSESYDAVILATPFALADLAVSINGVPLDVAVHPYQEVQATFVAGKLDPSFFGASPDKRLPSMVFTSNAAKAPFKSIGIAAFSPAHESFVYKIHSANHEMTHDELNRIFSTIHDVRRFVWRGAYPVISPGIDHLPFELTPGLSYACALETAVGAADVEGVGGWNAAHLITSYLAGA
ncbi:MAG: FAD-dependent oxidoreductase [Coriobacteriales bacterium]|nr:FAD-dependent oxidoreductase [Coriobacteriales bacterium]